MLGQSTIFFTSDTAYKSPRFFIFINVYRIVQLFNVVSLPPVFRVLQLLECVLRTELPCSQKATTNYQYGNAQYGNGEE